MENESEVYDIVCNSTGNDHRSAACNHTNAVSYVQPSGNTQGRRSEKDLFASASGCREDGL